MADPDRSQSVTDPEATVEAGTVTSDGATLMPPSEVPGPADVKTIPLDPAVTPLGTPVGVVTDPRRCRRGPAGRGIVADSRRTCQRPRAADCLTPRRLAPAERPPTVAPPTRGPARGASTSRKRDETLAPSQAPVPAGEATELGTQPADPRSPESSGTLLDIHLNSKPVDEVTHSVSPAHPVIPRVTGPGRPLPPASAPSTVARPLAMKTGRMAVRTLPQVAGYEVLSELGRGGMGVVYKARQLGLNRLVALKMVLTAGRASADELARFQAEAEAVALLHHPNIVQVYEVGNHEGAPYFSLEFCPGGTLSDRVAGKPQPPRVAARIVRDLARAVHHAHQRHILHRDLKPANVLIVPAEDGSPGEKRRITRRGRKSQKPWRSRTNPPTASRRVCPPTTRRPPLPAARAALSHAEVARPAAGRRATPSWMAASRKSPTSAWPSGWRATPGRRATAPSWVRRRTWPPSRPKAR